MNKRLKTLLWIGVFALFIGAAAYAYDNLSKGAPPQTAIDLAQSTDDTSGTEPVRIEDDAAQDAEQAPEDTKIPAPDFTVLDMDENPIKLSDMFGKPIVLNFWASWCPPCKSEMPEFDAVYAEVKDDVTFMMVDLVDGQRETKEDGANYIQRQGFSFPVYFDTEQEAAYAYSIRSIPTTLFIDKDGNVITGMQGAIDADTLRRGIDLIKQ